MPETTGRPSVLLRAALLLLSFCPASPLCGQTPSGAAPAGGEYALLVSLEEGAPPAEAVLPPLGAVRLDPLPDGRTWRVVFPPEADPAAVLASLRADPSVRFAEPDLPVQLHLLPDDPLFPDLWNLDNRGQTGGSPGADLELPAAWEISTGRADVIVGLIDTGVAWDHPDLAANIWVNRPEAEGLPGVDDDGNGYVDDIHGIDVRDRDSDPMDEFGHGSHVAGIIGAVGDNGIGVSGINWRVQLLPCKFTDRFGAGNVSDTIECMAYFRALKDRGENIVAINNSWGWLGEDPLWSVYEAMASLDDVLLVVSAGNNAWDNSGTRKAWPAAYDLPNLLVVGATDDDDLPWGVSNYGDFVDISAPGVAVLSTLSPLSGWGGGLYGRRSGTSMAAPHAAGVAALVAAAEETADWRVLRNRILSGGDETGTLDGFNLSGRRLNAYGALTCPGDPLLRITEAPADNAPERVGETLLLEALSIDCGEGAGPVVVRARGSGEEILLRDDGLSPDLAAGDGVFAASWIPTERFGDLRFGSPAGEIVLPALYPVIATRELPPAHRGEAYAVSLEVDGGSGPVTWSLAAGRLPEGLRLESDTGGIHGTAVGEGSRFVVQVTDSLGDLHRRELRIDVLETKSGPRCRGRGRWKRRRSVAGETPRGFGESHRVGCRAAGERLHGKKKLRKGDPRRPGRRPPAAAGRLKARPPAVDNTGVRPCPRQDPASSFSTWTEPWSTRRGT